MTTLLQRPPDWREPASLEELLASWGAGGQVRHLPGKHDQKSHGKGGGGASQAEAGGGSEWSVSEQHDLLGNVSGYTATMTSPVFVQVHASVSSELTFSAMGALPESMTPEQARRVVEKTTQIVGPLAARYGLDSLQVHLVNLPSSTGGETSTTDTGVTRYVRLNAALAADPSWHPWFADTHDSWVETGRVQGDNTRSFHPAAMAVDPFRMVVTHELGHVLDNKARRVDSYPPSSPTFQGLREGWGTRETMQHLRRVVPDEEGFNRLSGYGQTDPGEAYAELFSEWHCRDLAPAGEQAADLARLEGWEGA